MRSLPAATTWLPLVAAATIAYGCAATAWGGEPRPLFDGTTLAGWETVEGDRRWWAVADGAIAVV